MSKISAYVGLAQRSGSVLYGEDIICEKKNLVKVVRMIISVAFVRNLNDGVFFVYIRKYLGT